MRSNMLQEAITCCRNRAHPTGMHNQRDAGITNSQHQGAAGANHMLQESMAPNRNKSAGADCVILES
eukprot:7045721-Karenia_brevis.AAC.1